MCQHFEIVFEILQGRIVAELAPISPCSLDTNLAHHKYCNLITSHNINVHLMSLWFEISMVIMYPQNILIYTRSPHASTTHQIAALNMIF
jgi:hypothetical protein